MQINCIGKYKRLILVLSSYEFFSVSLIIENSVMLINAYFSYHSIHVCVTDDREVGIMKGRYPLLSYVFNFKCNNYLLLV